MKKDVPRADGHAVGDIGAVVDWLTGLQTFQADAKSSLAVLHNRNTTTATSSAPAIGSLNPKMLLCPVVLLPVQG